MNQILSYHKYCIADYVRIFLFWFLKSLIRFPHIFFSFQNHPDRSINEKVVQFLFFRKNYYIFFLIIF